MLYRERRREVAGHVYQAQLLATGLGVSQGLFSLWTQAFEDEVSHENYRPGVITEKKRILEAFAARKAVQTTQVKKVEEYSIKNAKDLQPYSKEERAAIQARLRSRELARAGGGA